jgi:hypothetical protein
VVINAQESEVPICDNQIYATLLHIARFHPNLWRAAIITAHSSGVCIRRPDATVPTIALVGLRKSELISLVEGDDDE